MAKSIAKIGGVALKPGVSRNGRLYTPEVIAKAVQRAQEQITATGAQPFTTLTHHGAADDSTRIVGRVTGWKLAEDGTARFEAELADTEHGHTILNLVDTTDGDPFLKGVSIRGQWLGDVQRKQHAGQMVETSDDLELRGLDYTSNPGVDGAQVDTVTRTRTTRETVESGLIFESVTDTAVLTESVTEGDDDAMEKGAVATKSGKPAAAPTKAKKYADPGYQDDKAPRYALDTKAQAKAAWSYVHQADNAKDYTAAQLKRIKGRIKAALTGFGVKVTTEGWVMEPAREVTEYYGDDYPAGQPRGCISISIDNGTFCLNLSSYQVDPADLDVVGRAAMAAACDAITAIDPDMDGDYDVPGDGDESAPTAPQTPTAETAAGDPTEEKEDPAMAESAQTPAAVTPAATAEPVTPAAVEATPAAAPAVVAPGITLTDDQFDRWLAAQAPAKEKELVGAGAPAESAPEAPAPVEEKSVVAETAEAMMKRLLTQVVQEQTEANGVQRKGLVTPAGVAESGAAGVLFPEYPEGAPQKPMHEFTKDEFKRWFYPQLERAAMGHNSVSAQQ